MKAADKLKRLIAFAEDEAEFNPYPESRKRAKAALDFDKPLVVSTPHRALGVKKD